jgi:hypothetical protein
MLAQMRNEGRLDRELEKTAQAFADLLYELISVRKVGYHQAWEMAVDQFLLPEELSSTTKKPSPPATSE